MPRVQVVVLDGMKLRNALAERGLTTTGAAARAGCSSETLRNALAGCRIGRLTAGAICRAVRLPLSALLAAGEQAAGPASDMDLARRHGLQRDESLAAGV